MKCPKCAAEAGSGRFCRSCGTPLATSEPAAVPGSICPSCGAAVRPGTKFCSSCAAPFGGTAPSPPAAADIVICVNCGAEAKADTKFCKSCGKPITSGATAITPDMMPTAIMGTPARRAVATPVSQSPQSASPAPAQRSPRPGGSNQMLAIAALVVLALVVTGLAYRLMSRKPTAQNSPIVDAPSAAQPAAPASAEPSSGSTSPESQPPATNETQQSAEGTSGGTTPAGTSPAGNSEAAGSGSPPPIRTSKRPSAKPVGLGYAQAHNNATQALAAAQYVNPTDSSALFWARKAKGLGDPGAAQIEQEVFAHQLGGIAAARQSHNYDQARALIFELAGYFPDHSELRQMQGDIQQEEQKYSEQQEQGRRQVESQAQTRKFAVQHRHGTGSSFCTGVITILPDGTAQYDCSTPDSGGRCEHVAFGTGSLKEVKVRGDGSLHVATRQQGNFDFSGAEFAIRDSATALATLVKH